MRSELSIRRAKLPPAQAAHAVERAAEPAAEHARGAFDTLRHPGAWFDSKPESASPKPVRLDDPGHPGHAMYRQSRGAVHHIDSSFQRTPDQRSDNLAVKAHVEGLTRVDKVALSDDGAQAFAVQNGIPTQTAYVETAEAVQTTLAQSSDIWQRADLQAQNSAITQPSVAPVPPSRGNELV